MERPTPPGAGRPAPEAELARGTGLLLAAVDGLPDAALDRESRLPGWNRRHLLAHLTSNAQGLSRLCHGVSTGIESRMYTPSGQREADIESGAGEPSDRIRQRLAQTAAGLAADFAALPESRWTTQVITALGRPLPAYEIPWLRAREVWLHLVDLDAGFGVDALPHPFCLRLVSHATGSRSAKAGDPAVGDPPLRVRATDVDDAEWAAAGKGAPLTVEAPLTVLAGWLTGRAAIDGVPVLSPWL